MCWPDRQFSFNHYQDISYITFFLCVLHYQTHDLFYLHFQFGNTCYCNSVLQALYFCRPFREKVLQYKQQQKSLKKETLLTCLADLFYSIATQKKKVGSIAPKKFIQRLRKENGKFWRRITVITQIFNLPLFIKIKETYYTNQIFFTLCIV